MDLEVDQTVGNRYQRCSVGFRFADGLDLLICDLAPAEGHFSVINFNNKEHCTTNQSASFQCMDKMIEWASSEVFFRNGRDEND